MPVQRHDHPALKRYMAWADASTRLLLIKSAPGTGRAWFAQSWIGDRAGVVHDWSTGVGNAAADLGPLLERLSEDADLRVAVILAPADCLWELTPLVPALVAGQRDLLLDEQEIAGQLGNGRVIDAAVARRIHELCGGWLGAARILALDSGAHDAAQRVIRNGLAVWLQHHDPHGTLSEVAFLEKHDVRTVKAFYGEFSAVRHTLEELAESGLLKPEGDNGWMMPSMVRQLLAERAGLSGRKRLGILEQASVDAMAAVHGVDAAAESAVVKGVWSSLLNLLMENWVEMFINNPRHLRAIAAKVPRFIAGQTEYMRMGLRILSAAGKDGMVLQLPMIEPDYATDRMAQQLHRDVVRLYHRPNTRALTMGMLEMFHLRLGGMYVEAGKSASQLREALNRALGTQNLKPSLIAIVELHAGISLQFAGRAVEAREAFQKSLYAANSSGKPFLIADAAGKLALLVALEGDLVEARRSLCAHEAAIGEVKWGREMVARSGSMASAYLAMAALDFAAADQALAPLPSMPDDDEFWAVHAHLLAMLNIREGRPDAARSLVAAMRRNRRFAAAAPLATKLLDDALLMVATLDRTSKIFGPEIAEGNPVLLTLGHLLDGHPDAALSVLHGDEQRSGVRGRGNLAAYLDLAARNPDGPTPQLVERVRRLHEDSGHLVEIAFLMMVPGWGEVRPLLGLDPDTARRLEAAGIKPSAPLTKRPALTPRELEVLAQLRAGMTRKEIAAEGYRSENTVKTQIRSLYRKLEVADLDQMLERARAWGL